MRECVDMKDIITRSDEVGAKKGVVDDGRVIFREWSCVEPLAEIISEFNTQFAAQFSYMFLKTPQYPVLVNTGSTGIYLLSRMDLTS
jgi:hypothetical protein